MTQPRIVGCHVLNPPRPFGDGRIIAKLTVESGALIVAGFALLIDSFGAASLLPPRGRERSDRIVVRGATTRAALVQEALRLAHSFTTAEPPLATASRVEPGDGDPSCTD